MNALVEFLFLLAIMSYLKIGGIYSGILIVIYIIWKFIGMVLYSAVVAMIKNLNNKIGKLQSSLP